MAKRGSTSGMGGGSPQAAGLTGGGQAAYSDIVSGINSAKFKKTPGGQYVMDTPYGKATVSNYTNDAGERSYAIDVYDADGRSIISNDRGYTMQSAREAAKHAVKSIYNPDKPTSISQLNKAGADGYQAASKAAYSISSGSTLTMKNESGNGSMDLVKTTYNGFKVVGGGGSVAGIGSVAVARAMMEGRVTKFKSR